MRSDVEALIKNKSAKDTDSVFSTYKNSTELGKKIYHSYKERRISVNGKNVFYADDKTKSAGYLSNIYGNTGLLSLVNRMNVKLNKADTAELIDSVLNIIDYIEENGFTLEPYISSAENRVGDVELFNLNYPYTGAMTWALSLFVSTRKLIASDLSVLTKAEEERSYAIEKGKEYTPESDEDREKRLLYTRLNKKLVVMIKDIVHTFNETFIEDGDKMGWAFTRGCKTPSLFFTYSVLEAYSDFDDNIIRLTYEADENGEFVLDKNGEKIPVYADPELLEAINRGNKGEPLHEQWRDKCFKVADKTWEIYKEVLKDSFVDDTFLAGFKPISRDDILKSNSSNALFNTIYLVFILFYGYVNSRKADAGDEVGANDVVQTMNAALQNVQRVYDQFKRDGIEYIVDTYYIGFKSKVNDKRREDLYTKHLNAKMLVDAKLMPTLVKANNVIAYYIERYPVKQMSILFEQLLDNLPATEGVFVWESSLYDVKITERYIEAIADFYMYYDSYERLYSQTFNRNTVHSEAKQAEIRSEAYKDAEAKTKEALAETHKKDIEEIRSQYTIENAITDRISKQIESTLSSALANIIRVYNGEDVILSDFESSIRTQLTQIISHIIETSDNQDEEE